MLCSVCFFWQQLPNTGLHSALYLLRETCAVTPITLPSSWNRCQSLEMTLRVTPSSSDTSSWVRRNSSRPIILPRKNDRNASFVP
ncbi:hypothetical protein TNCV_4727771 [Trichonephila clavipes]|nr:hypothetical protein TNCV_4727771 [Trichonephila clavipes]